MNRNKKIEIASLVLILLCGSLSAQEIRLSISFADIPEGSRLTPGMEIEIIVSGNSEGEKVNVDFYINDIRIGSLREAPYIFTLGRLPASSVYRLRAVASSDSAQSAMETILVDQQNKTSYLVKVNLVTVYATVKDAQGNYLRGLNAEDFIVAEDGVQQKLAHFSAEITPLTAAILLDISSSMIGERMIRAQNAALDLVRNILKEEDEMMVLGFDGRLLMYQPLTNDIELIAKAIQLTGPNGGTALYDAVAGTTRKLFRLKGKRALILLSDGDDTDSVFAADEVLDYLQKSGIILYSVGLQTLTSAQTRLEETLNTIRTLREMAEISGGQAYFPSFISHLPRIYASIGKDLSSQFTLSYYSSNKRFDGSWRTIKVKVKDRPNLLVRNRKGYFAK